MAHDVIVIGAGVSGLECARTLSAVGRDVLVVDRARGVGGRCATRSFAFGAEVQPVDFGPLFLHGADPAFLDAIAGVPGEPLDWPLRMRGSGVACQPRAFEPGQKRMALAQGLSAFPQHLARGLSLKLSTTVERLAVLPDALEVETASGERLTARTVVLALALEQGQRLLSSLPRATPHVAATLALLKAFASVPTLSLIAGYGLDVPAPDWDVRYPEESAVLQLISHDSAKRTSPRARVFVLQARPQWSRERVEMPAEQWAAELLAAAASLLGTWATAPLLTHPHRWRYARLEPGAELSRPIVLRLPGDLRLGLAGDLHARGGGGVETAWLSGRRLAQRILQESE